jgi:hypothetical protein
LTLNISALLDETGFVGSVRDWVELYLPYLLAVGVACASAVLVAWHLKMRRKRVALEKKLEKGDG